VPYPRKLLNPGEEIVLETRPNWSLLAGPVLLGVIVLGGLVAILVLTANKLPLWVGAVLGAVFLADLVYVLSRYIVWRTTLFVVTTNRVVYRTGVFARTGREIPLDRVQDVSFRQSLFERLVGAGSLTVESAGEHGQEPFPDITRPERVQSTINRLLDMSRQRDVQRATGQPILSIPEQIEKLSELYRRGVLTEQEFEQKKADLLDRL
jgi:membrane protein YdbS with pleckstrin-like domain